MKKRIGWILVPLALELVALEPSVFASARAVVHTSSRQPVVYHQAMTAGATDLGPANPNEVVSVSLSLKVRDLAGLSRFISTTVTPKGLNYRKYLTVKQFRERFAPSSKDIDKLVRFLAQNGLQSYVYPDGLLVKAVGQVATFAALMGSSIHNYTKNGQQFFASTAPISFPKTFQSLVLNVSGLNNYRAFNSLTVPGWASPEPPQNTKVRINAESLTPGAMGQYTPRDVAERYGVSGLYNQSMTGKGATMGIVTLASFDPKDAYTFWDDMNLGGGTQRISQVHVDGGAVISADAGSGETALDVEQAGGIAPDANIVVYDAPNSDEGFIDSFYKVVSDNRVDTLSVSWGEPEAFYLANQQAGELVAMDEAFMEAAAQGITIFSASGDSGAYDTNRDLPYPYDSKVISVDAPSSDPYVTAAGGTTLPGTFHQKYADVTVPEERAWGWDYFTNYFNTYYGPLSIYQDGIFSVGGGGGPSSVWPVPSYQATIPSMQYTQPNQSLMDYSVNPPKDLVDLPSIFAGRNTPDLSMNADPMTGYLVYSTPDGGWLANVGGTSFVAPQLNGMAALVKQYVGRRVGFLNPSLYALAAQGDGASTPSALNDITAGDNWYYWAIPGYDQATGVGTPNLTQLARSIRTGDWYKPPLMRKK